jgi:nitrogen fixation protein FixH
MKNAILNRTGGPARPLTGRRVLTVALGFSAVILLVNAAFIYLALDSFPGLATQNAYLKGLAFNETLAKAEEMRDRGWQVSQDAKKIGPRRWQFTLRFRDDAARPLEGLEVSLAFRRPASETADFVSKLRPAGQGAYLSDVTFPLAGNWAVSLRAEDQGALLLRRDWRLWVK